MIGELVPRRWSHDEFDAAQLAHLKRKQGLTASLCIPARDEEATVGDVVAVARRVLQERLGLIDEVVVVDDGSADRTAAVAAREGARVVAGAEVLPAYGSGPGKGLAMWKALFASVGDLVCWADADVTSFGHHYVVGLLGPLLTSPRTDFVKGYYHRPTRGGPAEGGRVTELVVRPLIARFFPHLAGFVQPLGGEYAGRREVLEAVPFAQGWGVELGLLLDVVDRVGIGGVAQVDLGTRWHRNRALGELAPQATEILLTALQYAGIEGPGVVDLVRFDHEHRMVRTRSGVQALPPLRSVADHPSLVGHERLA